MKRFVIVWSNGDKQKVSINDDAAQLIMNASKSQDWKSFTISTTNGGFNMNHVREFWIENE